MLTFATALTAAGIDPAAVRLLRHHRVYPGGRTPYSLWRDHRELFEQYQSTQDPERRAYFAAPDWASFVVPPAGDTLFVGLYSAALAGAVPPDVIDPLTGMAPGAGKGRQYDLYNCRRLDAMAEYVGQAAGEYGFLGRWREYVASGHGGNVGLRLRDPSDYQVSVLEVVGTNDFPRIGELEALWKRKLLSRDIGLNLN